MHTPSYRPLLGTNNNAAAWLSIATADRLAAHASTHSLYSRPTRSGDPKRPSWLYCGFSGSDDCYAQWFAQYVDVHEALSAAVDKPLVIEEFGLTWHKAPEYNRRALFQVSSSAPLPARSEHRRRSINTVLTW